MTATATTFSFIIGLTTREHSVCFEPATYEVAIEGMALVPFFFLYLYFSYNVRE